MIHYLLQLFTVLQEEYALLGVEVGIPVTFLLTAIISSLHAHTTHHLPVPDLQKRKVHSNSTGTNL